MFWHHATKCACLLLAKTKCMFQPLADKRQFNYGCKSKKGCPTHLCSLGGPGDGGGGALFDKKIFFWTTLSNCQCETRTWGIKFYTRNVMKDFIRMLSTNKSYKFEFYIGFLIFFKSVCFIWITSHDFTWHCTKEPNAVLVVFFCVCV